jgi:hypothetical protein
MRPVFPQTRPVRRKRTAPFASQGARHRLNRRARREGSASREPRGERDNRAPLEIPREPKGAAPTGLRSEERATREGGALRALGGERDNTAPTGPASEERARREGGASRAPGGVWDNRASGKIEHLTAGPPTGWPPGPGQRCDVTGRACGPAAVLCSAAALLSPQAPPLGSLATGARNPGERRRTRELRCVRASARLRTPRRCSPECGRAH